MKKSKIAALILTYNEEINIRDCIKSLNFTDAVFVYDSYSNDKTVDISEQLGATVFQRRFDNYAAQRNAALNSIPKEYDWVLMIDADERVTRELKEEILKNISQKTNTNTLYRVRRKDQFMGKWIRRSSGYPTWFPRLFKNGQVTVAREINEEYLTNGEVSNLENHLIHYPFSKGLAWWFERHNKYSSMEASLLCEELKNSVPWKLAFSKDPVKRRKFQKQFIYRLPGRPLLIFFAFYIIRGGFMDGIEGYRFCKLRKTYETMIDLKIKEIKLSEKNRK
jgi:glycosyltransferase involved in cell wall biosynthesis